MTNEGRQYIFRFPKWHKWIFLVGSAFFLALTVYALFVGYPEEAEWAIVALLAFGSLTGLQVWYFRHADDYVVADDSGLTHVVRGQETHLKWLDVRGVNHKTTRLRVTDAHGGSVMLDYALEDFQSLLNLVVDRTEDQTLDSSVPREFHGKRGARTPFIVAFAVALTIGILWEGFDRTTGSEVLWAVVFLGIVVVPLLSGVRRVTVTPGALIVKYWLKSREIPYEEISWISFGDGAADGVLVRSERGKNIELGHFKEGTVEFYRLLKLVLEEAQETASKG